MVCEGGRFTIKTISSSNSILIVVVVTQLYTFCQNL